MAQERTEYFSILTAKQPYEATEAIRIRLSQAKLVNRNFYLLFKEIKDLKKNYSQQLRKIIAENEDLNKILLKQMLDNQVLTNEELANFNFNSLGEIQDLWSTIIHELTNDLNSTNELYNVLNNQVVKLLKDNTEHDINWNESKKLHTRLSQIAATIDLCQRKGDNSTRLENANNQWASEVPYLVEVFETLDYNRLQTIKDCLLSYQTGYSDYLLSTSSDSENVMAKFLEFEPKNEISRFARDASAYNFILSEATMTGNQGQDNKKNDVQSKKQQNRKSSFSNTVNRFTSSSTVVHHDMMDNQFSDSSNNKSLKGKKSSNKLKNRVSSIFGKKNLLKNRKSQHLAKEDKIDERDSISSSTDRLPENSRRSFNQRRHSNSQVGPDTSNISNRSSRQSLKKQAEGQQHSNTITSKPPAASSTPQLQQPPSSHSNDMAPIMEFDRSQSTQETSQSSPFTMAQSPLQPQQKFKPLPLSPVEQASQSSQQQQQHQQQQELPTPSSTLSNENAPVNIQAPAVPPSRKQTISRDIPAHINSHASAVATNPYFQQQGQQQQQQQQQRAMSMISSQLTGELNQLNPQATGSSTSLQGQSMFQHITDTNSTSGLNASVAEIINATFKEGVLYSSKLIGEVALGYIPKGDSTEIPVGINMKINNANKFEKIVLNQAFIEQVDEENFKLNPQFIESRVLGAIKYSIEDNLPPIVIHPVWKFEVHQASVVLTIKIAPFVPESIKEIVLEDVVVYATVEGAPVQSALSKPQGSFSKEKSRITWRFDQPLVLNRDSNDERLIARFMTDGAARESPNGISLKFTIRTDDQNGSSSYNLGSNIKIESQELDVDNPFGGDWTNVHTTKTLAAGQYIGLA